MIWLCDLRMTAWLWRKSQDLENWVKSNDVVRNSWVEREHYWADWPYYLDCQGIKWSQGGVMEYKLIKTVKTGRNDGGTKSTGARVNLEEF